MNNIKKYLSSPLLKITWIILFIIFSIIYVYKQFDLIKDILINFSYINLIKSLIFISLTKILLVINQEKSQSLFTDHLEFSKNFYIYNFSQMAKYIPGSIWQFLGKANEYRQFGMKTSIIKRVIMVEVLFILIGSVLSGLIFLLLSLKIDFYLLFILIAAIFSILIFVRLPRLSIKKSKIVKQVFLLHLLIWFSFGLSIYFLVEPLLSSNSYKVLSSIIGYNALSFAAGYVAIFAPGGIGVREGILSFALSSLSKTNLFFIIGVHRILYFFVELFFFISSFFLLKIKKNNQ